MQLAMHCFVLKMVLLTPRTGGKPYAFHSHISLKIRKSIGTIAVKANAKVKFIIKIVFKLGHGNDVIAIVLLFTTIVINFAGNMGKLR